MSEEKIDGTAAEGDSIEFNAQNYLDNLAALKETTISREEYNKVVAENKKLASALVNGYSMDRREEQKPIDVEGLRRELFGNKYKKTTDLEFFTKVEELSKGIEQRGGSDPFLPNNPDYVPTGEDIERAQRIHSVIRDCIDYAQGDPKAFTNELARRCNMNKKRI